MTCKHENTLCVDSRPQRSKGQLVRDYTYIRFRRQKCLDCGVVRKTFEMTEQQLEEAAKIILRDHFADKALIIAELVKKELME